MLFSSDLTLTYQLFSILIFRSTPCYFLLTKVNSNSTYKSKNMKICTWQHWVGMIPRVEGMFCVSVQETGFSYSRVSKCQELDQVIIIHHKLSAWKSRSKVFISSHQNVWNLIWKTTYSCFHLLSASYCKTVGKGGSAQGLEIQDDLRSPEWFLAMNYIIQWKFCTQLRWHIIQWK